MSPRPRTVDDPTILQAAIKVMSQNGPERLTLAQVGEECGLSAATLVQRFGSKRELMLEVLRYAITGFGDRFEAAMAASTSPLDAIFKAAADRASTLGGSAALANLLTFYLSDLSDPEFRALAIENSRKAVAGFKGLLDQAVEVGELADTYIDTEQLAATIYSMSMGSLLTWVVAGEGNYATRIHNDLDVLLRPFRRGPRKASEHTRRPAVPANA